MQQKALVAAASALVAVAGVIGAAVDHATRGHPALRAAAYSIENEATRILRSGFSCGIERWDVKTLSDPAASTVALTPKRTTVPALRNQPVPGGTAPAGARTAGAESQVWLLKGTLLVAYKEELDSDIHLELQSTLDGSTMIAEIPDPNCVSSPAFRAQIAAARAAFVAQVGQPTGYYQTVSKHVQITGPAFFDFVHGQKGVAPNGVELHPLLSFQVLP